MTGDRTRAKTRAKTRSKAGLKGAVGAVSQSIADLKARSVLDLDPALIEGAGVQDRLESDDAEDARLRESIQTYGQQVPVLVRPHPETPDRYQIVYGRRRVLAARDLGLPVRAMVRDLEDQDLILAQGQENTARRDLSYIEKANFARQLRDEDYARKIICDALSIDKTEISRMLSIADRIPAGVLSAIGAAPGIGRNRWLSLAEALDRAAFSETECRALLQGQTSDARFESLLRAATLPERRAQEAGNARQSSVTAAALTVGDGRRLGSIRRAAGKTTLVLEPDGDDDAAFTDWLADNFEEVHRLWRNRNEDLS